MMAGLFAKDVKVKFTHLTAPAIEKDFELKEIEVSLKEETTVELTTNYNNVAPKPETQLKNWETTTTTV